MSAFVGPDLDLVAADFDEAVAVTPEIDPFCSTTNWVVPAAAAFSAQRPQRVYELAGGFAAFLEVRGSSRRTLHGLDPVWGLACPVVGADPFDLVGQLRIRLMADRSWSTLALTGVMLESTIVRAVVHHFGADHRLGGAAPMARHIVDLSDGADAFLDRRSARFRKALRQAQRRAETSITFEVFDSAGADEIVERAAAIERSSWKGAAGSGLLGDGMSSFYRAMLGRLTSTGTVWATIAKVDGVDAGYVFGATLGSRYRGFQLSYHQNYGDYSLGHLLQWHEIQRLAADGIDTYDMGMDMDYKRRWSDRTLDTFTLLIER